MVKVIRAPSETNYPVEHEMGKAVWVLENGTLLVLNTVIGLQKT